MQPKPIYKQQIIQVHGARNTQEAKAVGSNADETEQSDLPVSPMSLNQDDRSFACYVHLGLKLSLIIPLQYSKKTKAVKKV